MKVADYSGRKSYVISISIKTFYLQKMDFILSKFFFLFYFHSIVCKKLYFLYDKQKIKILKFER